MTSMQLKETLENPSPSQRKPDPAGAPGGRAMEISVFQSFLKRTLINFPSRACKPGESQSL